MSRFLPCWPAQTLAGPELTQAIALATSRRYDGCKKVSPESPGWITTSRPTTVGARRIAEPSAESVGPTVPRGPRCKGVVQHHDANSGFGHVSQVGPDLHRRRNWSRSGSACQRDSRQIVQHHNVERAIARQPSLRRRLEPVAPRSIECVGCRRHHREERIGVYTVPTGHAEDLHRRHILGVFVAILSWGESVRFASQ